MKRLISLTLAAAMLLALLTGCGGTGNTETTAPAGETTGAAEPTVAQDVTIKVAAIDTAYGTQCWADVAKAFEEQTGIKVELTTDKALEDVIGPAMQGGEFPDVIHLATGRPAGLTEQFIKDNNIADITDVLSMTVPGEDKLVSGEALRFHRDLSDQPLRRRQDLPGPHVLQPLRPVLQRRPV